MDHRPRSFEGEALDHALQVARLDLPADRRPQLAATAEGIYALIDLLDAVELGETPPATAFDARWEA